MTIVCPICGGESPAGLTCARCGAPTPTTIVQTYAPSPDAPWTQPRLADSLEELARLLAALRPLADALESLHAADRVWIAFAPLAIAWHDGGVRISNLEHGTCPRGTLPKDRDLLPMFAPPEVCRQSASAIGPATDVFHIGIFTYYWLAGLLPGGFSGVGLEAFSHRFPSVRIYCPNVPVGVPRVLHKALAHNPADRFASPADFCDALDDVLQAGRRRKRFDGALHWEIGSLTRTGRAKTFLGRDNEDHVFVQRFTDPNRALLAVADGITLCDVGSGALASLIVGIVLENAFDKNSHADEFEYKLRHVCLQGGQALLDWAIAKGYREQLAQGMDLMGSTLTAGWLEGRELSLGNLGDSRAYLIHDGGIEQLTVDGDLATVMLRSGSPPEEILQMGMMAHALSKCIGGCVVSSDGDVRILEDSCQPMFSTVSLVPGDLIVLCSDGLVEEGAFLEPRLVEETVRDRPNLTPNELALCLVDLADSLQRLPSPHEPDGFGDNISCIVVRIS